MAQSNVETCSTFACMICLDTPKEPENCQYCSQFVCKLCIDNLFEKPTKIQFSACPNCRKSIQRNNFKKLPCVQSLLAVINDREKELEQSKMNECSQHAKQKLCVYCSTCSKAICAQCISTLFNGEHINHVYCQLNAAKIRLLKIYKQQEKIIESDFRQIRKSIEDKTTNINQIQMQRQNLFDELDELHTTIKNEINLDVENLLKKFRDEQNILRTRGNDRAMKFLKFRETFRSSNEIQLFEQEKELTELILQRINLPIEDKIDLSNNFINNPLGTTWETGEFIVKEFSVKRKSNNPVFSSPSDLQYNQCWAMIVYPNGKDPHTDVYLSVMIELKKGISQLIEYDLIIELIHHLHDDNQHNYSLKSTKTFKEGQIESFDQFYELNKLSDNGFINPEIDSIKFRFKLRPKSIREERKLLQWQIDFYKKEVQNNDEQNKEMNKIKDELTQLQQNNKNANQIIEGLRNKIQESEKNDSECKRKRTTRNCPSRN